METKEIIPLLIAYDEGKIIEFKGANGWETSYAHPSTWAWVIERRIKQSPMYRKFEESETHLLIGKSIWRELNSEGSRQLIFITHINQFKTHQVIFAAYAWSLEDLFTEWKFYDQTTNTFTLNPVGILVE